MTDIVQLNPAMPAIDVERPDVFEAYVKWRCVPTLLRYPPKEKSGERPSPEDFAVSMGFDDPELFEMLAVPTQTAFAEKHGVNRETLTRWNKIIQTRDPLADIREWAKPLHKNVLLSLYNKAVRGGLPDHYKLWLQSMAGYRDTLQIDQRVIQRVDVVIVDPKEA